jgi:hypothetical protein
MGISPHIREFFRFLNYLDWKERTYVRPSGGRGRSQYGTRYLATSRWYLTIDR